ncbi:YeiH family protein [Gracilibacillus sp. D59]|uniref:YeiH family protein n=1 Tax=Gracilibacillus sp. D59 TaxID=3457434 RepID=UPI003FCC8B18
MLHSLRKQIRTLPKGVLLTSILAIISTILARLPFLTIMGVMILSIFMGMIWRRWFGVRSELEPGITFSTKSLLKLGIILLGVRLDIFQIFEDGFSIIWINVIVILFTLTTIFYLGKLLSLDKQITTLIAVGTAVCGASAIMAVAPLIKSNKQNTALAVTCISIIGTIAAISYILIFSIFNINSMDFGVMVGATLHEVSHVAATGASTSQISYDTAVIAKLGRVALLIPVAIVIGRLFQRNAIKDSTVYRDKLPIPWFIFGFLGMAMINSAGWISDSVADILILISSFLISMAMAGIGLNVDFNDLKKAGIRPVFVSIAGYISLLILVLVLIQLF